MKCRSW